MADKSREARVVPLLTGLLLLTLGASAWLQWGGSSAPAGQGSSAAGLVYSQTAAAQAQLAFAGDDGAWDGLNETAAQLAGVRAAELSAADKAALGDVRAGLAQVIDARGDFEELGRTIARLDELATSYGDGLDVLLQDPEVVNQPSLIAQLQRSRMLARNIAGGATLLPQATAEMSQQLIDTDAELQELMGALLTGNPALGIATLNSDSAKQELMGLSRRVSRISSSVRDALTTADRLEPPMQAAQAMADAAGQINFSAAGAPAAAGMMVAGYPLGLILPGVSALLALLILVVWLRSSGSRKENAKLVQQSESDQQAILQLLDELDSLADGDLTVQASVNESITGAIADSVNYAVEALRELVTTINGSAIRLDDATRLTAESARSLQSASEAQSRQVKGASAAVRQMAASIDEVSGNAERSADVARHSVDIAHKGGDAVRRTIEGMNTIRETIQDTSKRIKRLGESSQEIGDIVELINDIADQTNILALNASIQASMAGEAGRGFAVVADEVQRLAERSASATKQIEVLVSTIQSDTNEAVVSMERSTTDVVGGALLAENAGAALEEIEQVSNQIALLVQNISGSAKDQAQVAKAVLQNVEQLQVISGKTDVSASNTAKYISQLAPLAAQLRKAASGFTLPESDAGSPDGTAESQSTDTKDTQVNKESAAAGKLAEEGAA